jgi:hypothetical protein
MSLRSVLNPPRGRFGRVTSATRATIRELDRQGRLTEADRAIAALALSSAGAVDETPGNAQLVRQYRDTLRMLVELHDDAADGSADLIASMRAAVGDAEAGDGDTAFHPDDTAWSQHRPAVLDATGRGSDF